MDYRPYFFDSDVHGDQVLGLEKEEIEKQKAQGKEIT
jgi:hypothetical protein